MPKYSTPAGVIAYTPDPRFESWMLAGNNRVQTAYGVYSPGGNPRTHYGIDLDTADSDWTVHSTVAGNVMMSAIVTDKRDATWEWGHFVCVLDARGYRHYFCHLASRAVSVGQAVKAGDKLGVMGKTGNAAYDAQAEHVHYEVRKSPYRFGTDAADPTPWCGMLNRQGAALREEKDESGMTYLLELKSTRNNQLFETPDPNGRLIAEKDAVKPGLYAVLEPVASGAAVADTKWCKLMVGEREAYAVYGGIAENGARLLDAMAIAKEYGSPLQTGGNASALETRLAEAKKAAAESAQQAVNAETEAERQKQRADALQQKFDNAKTVKILDA